MPDSLKDDSRSTDELFDVATTPPFDDHLAWNAVGALHWRGTREILDRALLLLYSSKPEIRSRGADIIGQLGIPDRAFPAEQYAALLMLLGDQDARVISATITALSFVDAEKAADFIIPFRYHSDADVRQAVAFTLGGIDRLQVADALADLTTDTDADVRNWATFGLGRQCTVDNDRIRNALANRLTDDDVDVRIEAACGLAMRGDVRAVPFLIAAYSGDHVDDLPIAMGAARLLDVEFTENMTAESLVAALSTLHA